MLLTYINPYLYCHSSTHIGEDLKKEDGKTSTHCSIQIVISVINLSTSYRFVAINLLGINMYSRVFLFASFPGDAIKMIPYFL